MPLPKNGRVIGHLIDNSGFVLFNFAVRRARYFRFRCSCNLIRAIQPIDTAPPLWLIIWLRNKPEQEMDIELTVRLTEHNELYLEGTQARSNVPEPQKVVSGWLRLPRLEPVQRLAAE